MGALSGSADLLFYIKADNSDSTKKINQTSGDLKGLGLQAETAGGGFAAMANPAGLAATAITAVASAAVTAVAGIARLTVEAAEYGSAIFDASERTGLSAESLSALKYAADTSGSSLEAISGSVSKFSVLVGSANNGNEKAAATLDQYGISARDLDGALAQAMQAIIKETDATKQAAAAKDLFKDKTGQVLPVLKSFDGDLPGLISKLEKLGLVMSDSDARAADAFGDTLDTLKDQAAATGRQFATGLMPAVTHAMNSMSSAMEGNASVARQWGQALGETVSGVEVYFQGLAVAVKQVLDGVNYALGTNMNTIVSWSDIMISSIIPVVNWFRLLDRVAGSASAQAGGSVGVKATLGLGLSAGLSAEVDAGKGPGGGGRGGGGGSAKNDAEKKRKEAVQELQKQLQDELAAYQAQNARQLAETDNALARKLISEEEYIETINVLALEPINKEIELREKLRQNILLNAKEQGEQLKKIDLLKTQSSEQELKNDTKVIESEMKGREAVLEAIEAQEKIEKQIHEEELKRAKELSDERQKNVLKASEDKAKRLYDAKMGRTIGSGSTRSAMDDLQVGLLNFYNQGDLSENQFLAMTVGVETLRDAFQSLGQAIGQAVSAWVLYGAAGQSVRQVTAQILASVAQQAAVKAIFHLAEGFAALAMSFLGIPNAGPSAAAHFKAAALYGVVAGVAAVAGRGIAGDSFKQQAAGGGAGGGNGQNGETQRNQFRDGGGVVFGQRLRETIDRLTAATEKNTVVTGGLEEATHRFTNKFGGVPADQVLTAAAATSRGQDAILDGLSERLERGGGGSTKLARSDGRFN